MPYKNREDYNNYLRNYMRARRSVKPNMLNPVKPKLGELRQLIKSIESNPLGKTTLPLYNPAIHKVGEVVLVQRGKRLIQTTIPLLDADGQPVPDFA